MHMIDQDDMSRFYFESATHLPVEMQNVEELKIEEACEQILGMKPPFITRKYNE